MTDAHNVDARPGGRGQNVSRWRFLKLALAGVVGVLVVACAPAAGTDTPPAPAGEQEAAPAEQVLRVGWGGAPPTLTPITASADTEIAFLNAVYDYLIDTDANNELVPRLATGWTVSEDGTQVTLTIAEGVTFHSGEALTLDDIIWTFDRLRAPDAGATADLYANIESIEPGDGSTLVFTLAQPDPDFLYTLTDNHAVILQADAQNIGSDFNGTGPFQLDTYTAEDRASLVANPAYFQGAPGVGRLEFIYFGDNEAAVNALRGGVVDAVLRLDNATFLSLADDPNFNAVDVATNGHDLVRLRADRAPGDDPRVREAFKLATNREAIFERTQYGFGARGRDNPIGPLYSAYFAEDLEPLPYDPDRARELLAEAGYGDGLDMTLVVPNAPGRPALAEVLAAQWAEVGINVTIEVQEEAVYYGDEGWLEVDLAITPWGSRPVPQLYLDLAYVCGAQWNEAYYCNDELDALIATARSTLDEEVRAQAYRDIQQLLIEDGPVIIPYFFAALGVFSPAVENVELHPFPGRTNFHQAALGS